MCPWAWQRSKKPLELSSHRDRQPERGASGWNPPVGVMRFWACQRSKSPRSLALILTDNQSEGRRVDFTRQGGVYLGLATLEKPLELSSHRDRQPE